MESNHEIVASEQRTLRQSVPSVSRALSGRGRLVVVLALLSLVGGVLAAAPASASDEPLVMVWWTGQDNIIGEGWTDGTTVTLTADDPVTAADPDWTETVVVALGDSKDFDVIAGIDLRPGFEITATDGVVVKTLTLVGVIVTSIDVTADTVSGLAPPFAGLSSEVFAKMGGNLGGAAVNADASGRWVADFSVPHPQPGGGIGGVVDIEPGQMVNAGTGDIDSDYSYWQADVLGVVNVVQALPDRSVDLCLDGTKALLGLDAGEVVTSIPFDPTPPSSSVDLAVVQAGSSCDASPIAEAIGVSLLKNGNVRNITTVAHPTAGGTARLRVFGNDTRSTKPLTARVAVRQAADISSLTVWMDGRTHGQSLAPGDQTLFSAGARVHALWLSAPGNYLPVIGPTILKLEEGVAYQIHAWGDAETGFALAVIALPVGTR